jgi:hypothetical protein
MVMLQCLTAAAVTSVLVVSGCHDAFDGVLPYVCPSSDVIDGLPERLSETGLYSDLASDAIAPGVRPYRPRFELWSDGAEKRRWLALPEGTQIDSADPDDWVFPDGVRVWKEFSRDGVRIETRLIAKVGSEWLAQAYVWRDDESDAMAAPAGHIEARGTSHDVPAAGECAGCHGGRNSFVLGISAVQLGYDAPSGELDLADLNAASALAVPVSDSVALPGNEVTQSALGYLHANCGHCHNSAAPARPCLDPGVPDFWLRIDGLASVESTSTYTSAVDGAITPGDPDGSSVIRRMSRRSIPGRMPPLGSRVVDHQSIETLRTWISSLP